jgi:UDP-2,3-diacylglucosamine hydrolase
MSNPPVSGAFDASSRIEEPAGRVYFLSDVHLGGSPPETEATKRERLIALLDRVELEGASLYILGDLFDFWFDYRTVIPKTAFQFLTRLDALVGAGISVSYLGGNHDFWICGFLRSETRIRVLPDGCLLECQGRRAYLVHGDGLGPGDTGYKILKRVLRNPLAIRLFRWIHPDLGIRLAMRSSHVSREHTRDQGIDAETIYTNVAEPILRGEADAVLMGHHHIPVHLKREAGDFLILGDWFRRFTCARLTEGSFELLTWPLDS